MTVAEDGRDVVDDGEDVTIKKAAEDGIGSRDRSASSDTNLMRNATRKEGDRRWRKERSLETSK